MDRFEEFGHVWRGGYVPAGSMVTVQWVWREMQVAMEVP